MAKGLSRGRKLPPIMEKAVLRIKQASPGVNPYAAASSTLQKSGSLKQGTNTATKKGVSRGKMTRAQRHAPSMNRHSSDALTARSLHVGQNRAT